MVLAATEHGSSSELLVSESEQCVTGLDNDPMSFSSVIQFLIEEF
jgi:hypothetical protein